VIDAPELQSICDQYGIKCRKHGRSPCPECSAEVS
jgi:hypothetical protein